MHFWERWQRDDARTIEDHLNWEDLPLWASLLNGFRKRSRVVEGCMGRSLVLVLQEPGVGVEVMAPIISIEVSRSEYMLSVRGKVTMKSAMIAPYGCDAKQMWDYMMTVYGRWMSFINLVVMVDKPRMEEVEQAKKLLPGDSMDADFLIVTYAMFGQVLRCGELDCVFIYVPSVAFIHDFHLLLPDLELGISLGKVRHFIVLAPFEVESGAVLMARRLLEKGKFSNVRVVPMKFSD